MKKLLYSIITLLIAFNFYTAIDSASEFEQTTSVEIGLLSDEDLIEGEH